MSKYAFLFIDEGVEYQGDPTPEQQKTYGETSSSGSRPTVRR